MFANKEEKKIAEEISNASTNIGKGTILSGNIETFGNIRIEGHATGDVKSKSKVVLGESSSLDGNIIAQNAEIFGEVKGRVEISDVLTLKETAVVHGDIITGKLVVDSGAKFNGSCKMGVAMEEIQIGFNGQNAKDAFEEVETSETM